ncbi:hypothetical protein OKA05_22430 [Luteolibacter arcticus]|uniref:Uncharacterized protein n=1 Tax=Luteolibacter arcticus TaxID=1581411 RepID=A0ABT3GP91_9BACT|nr:hypothetical protein [Luteolibacter arcticus]MCW1925334.1 hypothetical protein [Luteolibacter arcticus]
MRIALLLLTFAAASAGCHKTTVTTTSSTVATSPDTLIAGTIIRSAGTWSAHKARTTQKLDVTVSGNSISWTIDTMEQLPGGGSSGGSGSSGMTLSSPTDPWFIFVESPRHLWFFNGTTDLTYSLSDGGGSRSGPAIHAGKLMPTNEKIPPDLVRQLPPDLQKQLPPVPPKEERPSL